MSEAHSRVGRSDGRFRRHSMALVETLARSPVALGFTFAAHTMRTIRQCWRGESEASQSLEGPTVSEAADLKDQTRPMPGMYPSSDMYDRNTSTSVDAANFLPGHILEKFFKMKAAQRRVLSAQRKIEEATQPTAHLVERINSTIQGLNERLAFNKRYEGRQEIRDQLSQRVIDLCDCLESLDRQSELKSTEVQECLLRERACGTQLVDAIEEWLAEAARLPKDPIIIESSEFHAPFDLEILCSAEVACAEQVSRDEEELEILKDFPFQPKNVPDSALLGRRGIKRQTCNKIEDTRKKVKLSERRLQKLSERRDNGEATGNTSDESDGDSDERLSVEEKIQRAEDELDLWRENLAFVVLVARQAEIDVTSEGSITGDRGYDGGTVVASDAPAARLADHLADEADSDFDPTPEEWNGYVQVMRADVGPGVESWFEETDLSIMPPGELDSQSDAPNAELVNAEPWDSVSNVKYGTREDLGYSPYRFQIDEMEWLREKARAQLPPGVGPAQEERRSERLEQAEAQESEDAVDSEVVS